MTQDERNLLEVANYYVVYSSFTGKPYINENKSCYIAETQKGADSFISNFGNCYKSQAPEKFNQSVYAKLYSYGIQRITLQKAKGDIVNISLSKTDLKNRQFFNTEANLNLYLLKETSKKKYLRELKNCSIYCPIAIDIRMKKQYPNIHYCKATINGNKYMVIFTTLQEFEIWNKKQNNRWKLLGTTIPKIDQERKGDSLLINPETDNLILDDRLLKDLLKERNN